MDIRDPDRVDDLFARNTFDAVLHLAAAHHDFGISKKTFHDVNVEGTKNICASMLKHGVRRLCFYSSVAVYGRCNAPPTEDCQPCPDSDYGETKLLAEEECQRWSQAHLANQALVIRPTVIFGPNNFANMYSLIRQIDRRAFVQVGPMKNQKSLAYIDNIVNATIEIWLDRVSEREPFEVFNYVDKPDLTSKQISTQIFESLNRNHAPFSIPLQLAKILAIPFDLTIAATKKNLPVSSARIKKLASDSTVFDSAKVHSVSKCKKVSIADGIKIMVDWYRSGGSDARFIDRRPPESA
ncbi:UDP-galactose-4-epimerase [Crateriforma conspicua]|uniref:UDP-galactose-4-epimerase n=2 Tax=Crateriforma conspicua TaxID=2527996 RepID=A0A5C6FVI3_9PLAN|nr:UDP-galactose-4-epimerase [Crateriforma conspicua]